jgi:hypothetical protein
VRLALPVLLAARLREVERVVLDHRRHPLLTDSWSTEVMSAQNAVCPLSWFAPVAQQQH